MKIRLCNLILILFLLISCNKKPINILLISSERKIPDSTFFEMFNHFNGIKYQHVIQPKANEWIEQGFTDNFDALVFYDLYDSITEPQKAAYFQLLKKGKPMLFIHHSLVSYQNWDSFKTIIGGKYFREDSVNGASTFEHNVTIPVKITDVNHPVTKGINNFVIVDETYDNCLILDDSQPLLTTDRIGNMPYLAWIRDVENSKVIYIQIGHDKRAFTNCNYQKIIYQAIKYLTK
ncbi:MAG: ThuA domain-containing protein [Marinilabiliaceae bacterium]|nr:ThuA domain-containing protein [Marinilabiliaceae bacterium]